MIYNERLMSKALTELYQAVAERRLPGPEEARELAERVRRLKRERRPVILCHNYQMPEVKLVADRLGDSYDLAVAAQQVEADWIVFCGVRFMAETAKLLNPDRKVVLPEPRAGCDLADSISAAGLRELKKAHPGARVVMYINCNIDVKAESDAICTSANALKVVEAMDSDTVIFGPDKNLGHLVAQRTRKRIIIWQGYCPIHETMTREIAEAAIAKHPEAVLLVHPETPPEVQELADAILGTQAMVRHCGESPERSFIIGTEIGLVERLRESYPDKRFFPIYEHKSCDEACACPFMKITELRSVLRALETGREEITIPPRFQEPALRAVRRMIEIGK